MEKSVSIPMRKCMPSEVPNWLNIILLGMNEYQNTGNMDVIKKCIHILHKNAESYCQHASQCKLRTFKIDHNSLDLDNSNRVPFINYRYNKTLKKLKCKMIPEIIENVFASMVNASFEINGITVIHIEDIEFIFCIVKYEKKDHAVCKFKGFPYFAFMTLEPVKTCKAFEEYVTNLRIFLDMLLWCDEILKIKQEKFKKLEAIKQKNQIIYKKIANVQAEKRFIYLQILVGFALCTDPSGIKAKELLDLTYDQWRLNGEGDASITWFNNSIKNINTKLWDIKDGKCFGAQFIENDITVLNCMGEKSGEKGFSKASVNAKKGNKKFKKQ